jgi:acyl carrier protein
MEIEEHFDISVPEDSEATATTVGRVVDGVVQLLGERLVG